MEQSKKDFYLEYYTSQLNKILEQSELMFVDKNMNLCNVKIISTTNNSELKF